MALPNSEFYRVGINFTGAGMPTGATVVLCFHDSLSRTPSEIGLEVNGAIVASGIQASVGANCDITSLLVKQGPDETGPSALISTSISGSAVGSQAAPNLAYLVHKHTAQGGRRGRGRSYWPGPPEDQVTEAGLINSGVRTQFASDYQQMMDTLTGNGIILQVEHQPATEWELVNGQPRRVATGSAPEPSEVTLTSVDSKAATQRRRLRR